jgi:hypothetical protein
MRLRATAGVVRRHLINARNEGVRGSNPRVGSLKAPLSGVFVCWLANALLLGSHQGRTPVVCRTCFADEVFRGDGFGVFEFVEDVAVGVERHRG